jgi:hypothetical protein
MNSIVRLKYGVLLVIALSTSLMASAQEVQKTAPQKPHQAELMNEFFIAYGLGSVFTVANQNTDYSYFSPGTFIAGYQRSLNRVIAVGFIFSYTQVTEERPGTATTYSEKNVDNYWQGIAGIKFRYLNRPSFSMYSGAGIGVTMDYYTERSGGSELARQKLLPAGQLTLLGFRVGRSLAFFGEFGVGTNYILTAGISYKLGE